MTTDDEEARKEAIHKDCKLAHRLAQELYLETEVDLYRALDAYALMILHVLANVEDPDPEPMLDYIGQRVRTMSKFANTVKGDLH